PYIFIWDPILVLVDVTPVKLVTAVLTSLIGMIAVSSSMVGFFVRNSKAWERILLFVGGLLMIDPGFQSNMIGLAIMAGLRSEEHTSELQSRFELVCRLILEKKKKSEDEAKESAVEKKTQN